MWPPWICCGRRPRLRKLEEPLQGNATVWASIDPGDGISLEWLGQFPLKTQGRNILNSRGKRFRLRAVNWYGASDAYHVVGGLDVQRLEVICETIRSLGFNCVRLPFSNEMLRNSVALGAIDFDKNPHLRGLSPLEVLDEVVRGLGRHSVAVVLNNHTTYGEWCHGPDRNGLWFHPGSAYTEKQWIEDWGMIAARYSRCPHVVGCDLRNEVRFYPALRLRWPMFGSSWVSRALGGSDWAAAALAAARQILEVSPHSLIVVERIVWPSSGLKRYAACPGPLLPALEGRLVLGVHSYSWSGPGRYLAFAHWTKPWKRLFLGGSGILNVENYGMMTRDRLSEQLLGEWGFLLEADACPVWMSEFGAGESSYDLCFLENLVSFLALIDADWAYWPLNVGPKPRSGDNESYGMLTAEWTQKPYGVEDRRLELLRTIGLAPAVAGVGRE